MYPTAALAAFALLTLIWGYNWVVMKIALEYASALDFAVLRTVGGAACLFLLLPLLRTRFRPPAPARVLLLGLLQTTGFLGLVTLALESEGAGKTAVLAFTMPFWVLGFAAMALGERVRDWQWLAVALAATGLMLIIGPWDPALRTPGSLLAVAAGACWGASVVVAKTIRVGERRELVAITAWQMALGALPLIAIALFIERPPIEWNWVFAGALAFNILPANALAWLFWLYIVQRLSANVIGLSSLAIPVVGGTAAWLQLGESPAGLEGLGMVLILTALAVLSLRGWLRHRQRQKKEAAT
jgi:drug/metabolite transporter (DMT)-like permease